MSVVTIFYYEASPDGSGASLLTEKTFNNYNSMSQFKRRNKLKNVSVYVDGYLSILVGNHYLRVSDLMARCSTALLNSPQP